MLPPIPSVTLPESVGSWIAIAGFGAYHGLNPGMGWLFALSAGLQQRSERAVWVALVPIAAGHAASVGLVAAVVLVGLEFLSTKSIQIFTAAILLGFGGYKLLNYYRHPRWVGMKVGFGGLFAWSFLMATAHGAGLMVAPWFARIADASAHSHSGAHAHHAEHLGNSQGPEMLLAVGVHTLSMFAVMGFVALIVFRKLGLGVLRQAWINFDLIWAAALLVAGAAALVGALV